MIRSNLRTISTVALVALAACEKSDAAIQTISKDAAEMSPSAAAADARGHAMVRVVNAGSGTNPISLQMDGVSMFQDVQPGKVTDYRETSTLMASFTSTGGVATDGKISDDKGRVLLDGERYTVFVISQDVGAQTMRVVHDDVIPDSGMARIRLVHAAPGGPSFDVRDVGNDKNIFSDVDFKDEAGYVDVKPTAVNLELRAAGKATILLRIPTLTLQRGVATTIVVTGSSKLSTFTFTDAVMKTAAQ